MVDVNEKTIHSIRELCVVMYMAGMCDSLKNDDEIPPKSVISKRIVRLFPKDDVYSEFGKEIRKYVDKHWEPKT